MSKQLFKGPGLGTSEWREPLILTATDSITALFEVDLSGNLTAASVTTSGSTSMASLTVSGSLTLSGASSLLDLSAISAGNNAIKITPTSATPTVTWTGSTGTHINSTAPAGYVQIVHGSTVGYVPFWA